MNTESKKCYLVVCEVPYESHKFENAQVYLTREAAQEYMDSYIPKKKYDNRPNEIIELTFFEI